jgi:GNAT superfamily N-acetyltransferase
VNADRALAKRLESDDALNVAACVEAYGREAPGMHVATLEVGGGWAGFAEPLDFLSQAKGLGMEGPVSTGDLDRIEDFYQSRGAPAQVVVCPFADPSVLDLTRRGFRIAEFENALVVEPGAVLPPPSLPGVETWRAGGNEVDVWAETCARGFFPAEEALAVVVPAFRAFAKLPEVEVFLARIDGQVAGASAIGYRDGLAGFFGTSVLPEFRNRGAHRELIRARVEAARVRGADLLRVTTLPGSDSQRNFERWGFRPAYTRAILIREWT